MQSRPGEADEKTIPDFGREPVGFGQPNRLKVQLIDMRYFAGTTAEESAAALSILVHVVRHELRLAQAWLRREIAG